ncbi:MAG: DUF4214 domain-containing protein [Clostridiales bacterium]|nr:DUF4214 domain-containing protein [Clostridiales bacterium]
MKADLDERIEFESNCSVSKKTMDVDNDNLMQFFDLYCDFHKKKAELNDADIVIKNSVTGSVQRVIDVNNLYSHDGEKFVRLTYFSLFGRSVGMMELEEATCALSKGTMTKQDLVLKLAASDEGKQKNVVLSGIPSISVYDIMKFEDREFVRVAYVLIMGRQSDLEGEEYFLNALRTGVSSKPETIKNLRNSEEANKVGLEIRDVDKAISEIPQERRLYTLPVIGKFARFMGNLRKANREIKELQLNDFKVKDELNSKIATSDESIRDLKFNSTLVNSNLSELNSNVADLFEKNRQLNAEVKELREKIELLSKESR